MSDIQATIKFEVHPSKQEVRVGVRLGDSMSGEEFVPGQNVELARGIQLVSRWIDNFGGPDHVRIVTR